MLCHELIDSWDVPLYSPIFVSTKDKNIQVVLQLLFKQWMKTSDSNLARNNFQVSHGKLSSCINCWKSRSPIYLIQCFTRLPARQVVAAWGFLLVQGCAYGTPMCPFWPWLSRLVLQSIYIMTFPWLERAGGGTILQKLESGCSFRSFTPPDCRRWPRLIISRACYGPQNKSGSGDTRHIRRQTRPLFP